MKPRQRFAAWCAAILVTTTAIVWHPATIWWKRRQHPMH